jgi:hypothetical protein
MPADDRSGVTPKGSPNLAAALRTRVSGLILLTGTSCETLTSGDVLSCAGSWGRARLERMLDWRPV